MEQTALGKAVYPRLRGERQLNINMSQIERGLSPASRGTPPKLVKATLIARFIPGFAGNAVERLIANGSVAVYPRLRGERQNAQQ